MGTHSKKCFHYSLQNVVRPKRTVQTDDIHTQLYIRLYIVRVDYVYADHTYKAYCMYAYVHVKIHKIPLFCERIVYNVFPV